MRLWILSLLALLMALPVESQTISVVQDEVANGSPIFYFHQRKIARTSNGILMAAWNDFNAAGGQIVYSIYDEAFLVWSPPVALTSAGDRAIQVALASDESGNIHATWQQRASTADKYQVWYGKYNGASWSTPIQISVAASVRGEEATIEVDSRGWLWVVYNNDGEGTGNEFIYAINSTDGGTTWSATAEIISNGGAIGSSIEVARVALASGPAGRLFAVWDNSLSGTASRRETFVNQYDGASWLGETLISDTTVVDRDHNRYSASAIDNQSNVYAFYGINVIASADPRPRYLVMHKKGWSDPWTLPHTATIDTSTLNFRSVTAVVDSNDAVYLAYRRDNVPDSTIGIDEIAYTHSTDGGSTWSDKVVLSRPDKDAGYVTSANRVRAGYGVDILFRESRDPLINDQDTTTLVHANVPQIVTSVPHAGIPIAHTLMKNYPNPFNPTTTLQYSIPVGGFVAITITDALGRIVQVFEEETAEAGEHTIEWDGKDRKYRRVSSGMYYARLASVGGIATVKMMLLK